MQRRHFTLLELMAAMVVLVIMMGFLFNFITKSQDLWTASERNSRIYENAQVFFELFGRDLSSVVTSDEPGQQVGFWVGPNSGSDGDKDFLAFATMSPCSGEGESKVWEVHYKWGSPTAPSSKYLLRRSTVTDQVGTTPAPDPDWDFYGKDATQAGTWVGTDNLAGAQEVIDGVENLEILCYEAGTASVMGVNSVHFSAPAAVKVTITLVDQKSVDKGLSGTDLDFCRREFTKIIFLNR